MMFLSTGFVDEKDIATTKILEFYHLHPEKIISHSSMRVPNDNHFFILLNDASKDVGYNLKGLKGEKVDRIVYQLKERSQEQDGKIYAIFLFKNGKLVGAYLSLEKYLPGVTSLKDRSSFAPEKLSSNSLVFEDISKIELYGPFIMDSKAGPWEKSFVLKEKEEINNFISLLRKSVRKNGEYSISYSQNQKEYLAILHYKSGPEIRVRLVITQTSSILTFDNFRFCHYEPPKELRNYMIGKLR